MSSEDGITVRQSLQITSATKSSKSDHSRHQLEMTLSAKRVGIAMSALRPLLLLSLQFSATHEQSKSAIAIASTPFRLWFE
jgi:hypothetical protein